MDNVVNPAPEQLKASIGSSGKILLSKAVGILAGSLGHDRLPTVTAKAFVLEPSEPGRRSGKHIQFTDLDIEAILNIFRKAGIEDSAEWSTTRDFIQAYIDYSKIKPALYTQHDVDNHYLRPLLRDYLRGVDVLLYNPRIAGQSVARLIRHLSSSIIKTTGLIVLEGFQSSSAFHLEPTICVRPIKEAELRLLGRTDSFFPPPKTGLSWPSTDWWMCEVKFSIERGTGCDSNELHEIARILMLALRVFKSGQASLGVATTLSSDGFGSGNYWRGGRAQRIAMDGQEYVLSDKERISFVHFWKKLHRLIKKESHYLSIPARRLLEGGMRSSRADALVDYVIGIEALLGLADERTELSYRFRVRGSVILSKRRSERKANIKILRDLYDLRSKVVHGQKVSEEKLEKALPQAENALRSIWRWYFKHFHDKSSNRAGIERIDEELVIN